MTKTKRWIILALLFAALITVAVLLYNNLSTGFFGGGLQINSQQNSAQSNQSGSQSVKKAPNFTVLDQDGNSVKLSDFRGKPVVINFWATWCFYCTSEMPTFNNAYLENPDVQFLMVNASDGYNDTVSSAQNFMQKNDYQFPVFFDTTRSAQNAYGINSYPYTFFIDSDGVLVATRAGRMSSSLLEQGISLIRET